MNPETSGMHTEFDATAVANALRDMASAIVARVGGKGFYLVGLERRGVHLAHRLGCLLSELGSPALDVGTLDISLYRDDLDLGSLPKLRESNISFDLEEARVILVDDVLYTGRTIRAAIEAMLDYGRPAWIQLAVLLDRGGRELPIHADYCGLQALRGPEDYVRVALTETDGLDAVLIGKKQPR